MFRVAVNGREHDLPEGLSILQGLQRLGVSVPALCHDDRLAPAGACRLCVVKVEGFSRPVAACTTPLGEGLKIETHPPEIERERKTLLALLARGYPREAVERFPEKEFHRLVRAYGVESELEGVRDPGLQDDSHPYLHVDMSQCITCYRCVRICNEVQGQFVWEVWNRGDRTRICPDSGTTLRESSCVACGACAHSCPTGAIEDRGILERGVPVQWTRTVCPYCGVGCEIFLGTREGRIVTSVPVLGAPVNKGHLCVKGRYAWGYGEAADRMTRPMIREGSRWKAVSWGEAIAFAAREFTRLVERYGPAGVGVLGSARATHEENYLAQKFARVVLGTNNVDCCARVCHAPSAAALKAMLGTGAATNGFDDIEEARTILVCGSNATENHPIVGARIKQQALRGANLIVVDPRRIELAEYAAIHLPLRLGTNVALFNAMAWTIVEEGLFDRDFIEARVSEWGEFREFIRPWSPERASEICGVGADLIRRAARLYATAKPALSVHGLGLTEHTQGTESIMALVNLALLTGNLGKPGTGIHPLRGQNNVQGAAHMGCEPDHLTGYVSLEAGRARFEAVWKTRLPAGKGLNLLGMLEAARAGTLKGLWAIGYDILLTSPDASRTRDALRSLQFLIVQDLFLNETAREAGTVFFPVASSFEKDGTFMNAERRIQRVRKAIEPPGESKTDWEIIQDLARAMGKTEGFEYRSTREIWEEIRQVWPAGAGITYERLEGGGISWPCPSEDHPGTRILHRDAFPVGVRAALRRVPWRPTPEVPTEEFPYLLTTGRTLYPFNAGTMTRRTPNVALWGADVLEISPEDAARLGLRDGDRVRLSSRYGRSLLAVSIDPAVKPGELFTTFHTAEVFINKVTSPLGDPYTGTPEYKVTAVKIEKG